MGRAMIVKENEVSWTKPAGREEATNVEQKIYSGQAPRVFMVRWQPGKETPAHSHKDDEVIYVLEGEFKAGETTFRPGTALFVERDTVYGPLVAGPQGARFVNISLMSPTNDQSQHRVRIVDGTQVPWNEVAKDEGGRAQARQKHLMLGAHGDPEVFLVNRYSHFLGRAHSHTQDEVIFVLEGEMWVGDTYCPPQTMVYVEKDTVYGPLKTQEKGATFLNVRPMRAGIKRAS